MRILFFSFLSCFLWLLPSGLKAQHKPFVPLIYEYPRDILSSAKTYVFKNTVTGELSYKAISRHDTAGTVTITWRSFGSSPAEDSAVEVNDKLVDHYLKINGQQFRGVRSEDSIYQDGSRLGEKRQAECFDIGAALRVCADIRSHFQKDTLVTWKGKKTETVVIKSVANTVFENPTNAQERKELSVTMIYYFGKEVGLLRYSSYSEDKQESWILQEIKTD